MIATIFVQEAEQTGHHQGQTAMDSVRERFQKIA